MRLTPKEQEKLMLHMAGNRKSGEGEEGTRTETELCGSTGVYQF